VVEGLAVGGGVQLTNSLGQGMILGTNGDAIFGGALNASGIITGTGLVVVFSWVSYKL
jgi:hypothetical protein